jgi:NAD(P)-dependent dehydrogenase (short-subunit alcohol dehydrogenase family)
VGLVNNADIGSTTEKVETMAAETWDRFFDVDLKAAWLTTKHVLPQMRAAGRGAIVNIASIHAHLTQAGTFPYAAAKSGVLGHARWRSNSPTRTSGSTPSAPATSAHPP